MRPRQPIGVHDQPAAVAKLVERLMKTIWLPAVDVVVVMEKPNSGQAATRPVHLLYPCQRFARDVCFLLFCVGGQINTTME
jgi:hypothetical protein